MHAAAAPRLSGLPRKRARCTCIHPAMLCLLLTASAPWAIFANWFSVLASRIITNTHTRPHPHRLFLRFTPRELYLTALDATVSSTNRKTVEKIPSHRTRPLHDLDAALPSPRHPTAPSPPTISSNFFKCLHQSRRRVKPNPPLPLPLHRYSIMGGSTSKAPAPAGSTAAANHMLSPGAIAWQVSAPCPFLCLSVAFFM